MAQAGRVTSQLLAEALSKNGLSNRELAEEAGVSFRAVAEARNGFDRSALMSKRKRLGVASSITRLAIFLGLEPREVLRELGIDPTDAMVRRHVERARETSTASPQHPDDYVLQAVRARESSRDTAKRGPIVGIVPWIPFSPPQGEVSVARLLARSVLGSLNQEWDRLQNLVQMESFAVAEKLLRLDDPGTPEVLIGLYDLPWRRRGDIDIVAIPGLHVRVGGLCTRHIRWTEILGGTGQNLPSALAIEGDVGDKLLAGPADYPETLFQTTRQPTRDPKDIAKRVKLHFDEGRQRRSGSLFVADGPLLAIVHRELGELGATHEVHEVTDPSWAAPTYRFGFAVRIDSPRFKELLEESVTQDLFGRVFPRTAYLYLKLLKSDLTGHVRLVLGEIARLRGDHGEAFVRIAKEVDQDWEGILDGAIFDKVVLDEAKRRVSNEARD